MISSRIRYGLSLLLLLFVTSVWPEIVIPKLSERVTDLTGTLNAAQVSSLETKLAAFEAKKGSQIAVLIVPTTQPQDIAEYGIQVADLWQLGRKGVDDGVIFIIAKDDHKLRLEVGRGLEGVIPDAIAKRIIAETVTPYFKTGDFVGGIDAGVSQLISLIDGEALPEPKIIGQSDENSPIFVGENGYLFVLMAGLFVGSILTTIFGRLTGGIIAGVGSAAVVALLFGLGLAALVIGFLVFFMIGAGGGGGGWSNGGGFGRGGGGSWGGGGGSSSWGGGGGSFGGGGASGSW